MANDKATTEQQQQRDAKRGKLKEYYWNKSGREQARKKVSEYQWHRGGRDKAFQESIIGDGVGAGEERSSITRDTIRMKRNP